MNKIRIIFYDNKIILDIMEISEPFRKDGSLRSFISKAIIRAIKQGNTIKIENIGEGE